MSNGSNFQPQYQTPPQQFQPPKKSHTFRNVVLGILVGGFLLIAGCTAIILLGANSIDTSTLPTDKPTTSAPAEPDSKTTAPAPTKTAVPAVKWVKLVTLSGSADKSSDTIKTTGGKIRITYSFKVIDDLGGILAAVYLLDEGTDLVKDGGVPDVTVRDAGKDFITLRKAAGEYYLRVMAANARYTVTVEEQR